MNKGITKNFFCQSDFEEIANRLRKSDVILKTINIDFVKKSLPGINIEIVGENKYRLTLNK